MTVQPTRDQLRALANAATPGPWEDGVDDLTDVVNVHHDGEYRLWVADCGAKDDPHARADAEFIAAARTAVPHLLDQLDQAEARLKDVLSVAQEWESAEVRHEVAPIMRAASARIRRALEG